MNDPQLPEDEPAKTAKPAKASPEKRTKKRKRREPRTPPERLHKGTVTEVSGADVLVDLGPKVHGVIPVEEFEAPPAVGDEFDFSLVSLKDDRWILSRHAARVAEIWQHLKVGQTVEAKVVGYNSGGLEARIGPVAAFAPVSQLEPGSSKDLTQFAGQTLTCEVLELNRSKKRVLISRKAIQARANAKLRKEELASLAVDQVVTGKIEKLESFGAFVRIGDHLTGLLHVSNLAHQRVQHPSDLLKVGQEVQVKILELKESGKRIGLGMKQLQSHPWDRIDHRYPPHSRVKGKVTRATEFGAFVLLEPGVEGLIHISELGPDRINKVEDAVKSGDEVFVRVLAVDTKRRRLSLSRMDEDEELLTEASLDEEPTTPAVEIFTKENLPTSGTNLGDVLRRALEGR